MAAHVVEGAEDAIVAASDKQRLADQVKSEVIAGLRDLMNVPYQLPCTREDSALLLLEGFGCEIALSCQRGGTRNVSVGIHLQIGHSVLLEKEHSSAPRFALNFRVL